MHHDTPQNSKFFEIACDATFEDVRMILRQLDMRLKARGVDPDKRGTAQLVLAETMNNVVEHAYNKSSPTRALSLEVEAADGSLLVTLKDNGAPVPWSKLRNPGILRRPIRAKFARESGFGWPIITALASDLTYHRTDDQNVLMFKIDATEIGGPAPGMQRRDARLFETDNPVA